MGIGRVRGRYVTKEVPVIGNKITGLCGKSLADDWPLWSLGKGGVTCNAHQIPSVRPCVDAKSEKPPQILPREMAHHATVSEAVFPSIRHIKSFLL